ncbi:alpha/beta hydrolase-fold protein [Planctomicrobium sp. SH661]|uniref:carboxylesterase family protein n=1 Tax=Planctomicrobium sp. SH661 TaxID=3448124 RepID=UPI003F5B0355
MQSFWRIAVLLTFLFSWGGTNNVRAESTDRPQLPPGFQLRNFEDATGTHRYTVFVPKQYDASRKWPVALFLHGAGEKGTDGKLPLAGLLAVALEKSPETPFIAVFPQCEDQTSRALTGWLADSSDGQRAMKILDAVEREFSVDPDHRMLIGWSMGGYGAWSQAAAHPEKWSSVLILAGGAIRDELPLAGLAERKTPVWAVSAKGDPLISFERSEKLIQQLNQLGGRGTFTLLDSDDHDVCRTVFASPQTFEWLQNPGSIDPASIDLKKVTPLPARTRFYNEALVETRVIPNSFAVRLGNRPFAELANELPELLLTAPIAGTLPDIERSVGSGTSKIDVKLMELSYRCEVTRIWMHAISGGRLGLDVSFQPLALSIGKTSLDSLKHQARTGPIQIQIGVHKPAQLKLEVQPVISDGKLHLKLLRSKFMFDQGNWYITPPTEVQARSDQFTPDQLVTGIIGSLYDSRQELIDQVLNVVPDLIKKAEAELQMREAPGLARLLSPLPVLVPELKVSPSQVRTDGQGVSVLCDLNVSVRGKPGTLNPGRTLQLTDVPRSDQLSVAVAMDAVTSISQLNVEQNFAHVNVLDISDEKFAQLADPQVINRILPELNASEDEHLSSVLRLLEPMVVSKAANVTNPGSTTLLIEASAAAIDVYRRADPQSPTVPAGRIVFSLSQPISIEFPADRDDPEAALQLRWTSDCHVEFLRGESLQGSPQPQVHAEEFEKTFADAWTTWGQAHGEQKIPLTVSRLGTKVLQLDSLQATDDRKLNIGFEARNRPVPAPVPEEE